MHSTILVVLVPIVLKCFMDSHLSVNWPAAHVNSDHSCCRGHTHTPLLQQHLDSSVRVIYHLAPGGTGRCGLPTPQPALPSFAHLWTGVLEKTLIACSPPKVCVCVFVCKKPCAWVLSVCSESYASVCAQCVQYVCSVVINSELND